MALFKGPNDQLDSGTQITHLISFSRGKYFLPPPSPVQGKTATGYFKAKQFASSHSCFAFLHIVKKLLNTQPIFIKSRRQTAG